MEYFEIPPEARGEYKITFFAEVFFGTNCKAGWYNVHEKYMKEHYPSVLREIIKHKKENGKKGKNSLAVEMQKLEADLVLDKIVNAVLNKHPSVKLLTLHDALYTTEEFYEILAEEVLKQFQRWYKVEPSIAPEDYNKKQQSVQGVWNAPEFETSLVGLQGDPINGKLLKHLSLIDNEIQIFEYPDESLKAIGPYLGEVLIADVTHLQNNSNNKLYNLKFEEFLELIKTQNSLNILGNPQYSQSA